MEKFHIKQGYEGKTRDVLHKVASNRHCPFSGFNPNFGCNGLSKIENCHKCIDNAIDSGLIEVSDEAKEPKTIKELLHKIIDEQILDIDLKDLSMSNYSLSINIPCSTSIMVSERRTILNQ